MGIHENQTDADYYNLTYKDLSQLEEKVIFDHDGRAARRIRDYYLEAKGDRVQTKKWHDLSLKLDPQLPDDWSQVSALLDRDKTIQHGP